jgi:hypothetical protein
MADNEAVKQIKTGDVSANDSSSPSRQSTGPRTSQGEDRSKYNAVKHGIFSKVIVLKGEPRIAFDALLNGLFNDLRPDGELEEILVEKLAILIWRYRRLIVAEAENRQPVDFLAGDEKLLNREHLLRYEASIERSFDRTLSQLERAQRMRLGQPILPPIKLDVSSV